MTGDYRVIPGDIAARDLVMTHISTNFDRTGFQQDWNVVFPLDRLKELARGRDHRKRCCISLLVHGRYRPG